MATSISSGCAGFDTNDSFQALLAQDPHIKFFNNQVKPDVNAQVTYGAIGIGGTQTIGGFNPLTGISTPVQSTVRSYGSALSDVFSNAFPQWAVGLQIGYPLGANTAHANLARVKLEYDQAQTQLKNMQMQVTTQVRQVARDVQKATTLLERHIRETSESILGTLA